MSPSPLADKQIVERFLRTQRFRNRDTGRIYGYVLRAFQRFAFNQSSSQPLSVPMLQQWLQERRRKWPLHMVCHRARLVERFLEWLQAHGVICTNPFADLHRHYRPRTTPIIRALVSDDSAAALQQLRPQPRFGSFLGELMEEHVTLMRALGYRYKTNEGMLLRFDRFLQGHAELASEPLNKLVETWSERHPSPNHLREAQKVGRLVSKAMHRLDPSVAVLPLDGDRRGWVDSQERQPYLYTDQEIQRILQAALSFPSPKAPLRPLSLYTMVVLAYCAGLRVGEVLALTLADVNLHDETIEVRNTKFFKSRRLPLAPGVMEALKRYLHARQQAGAPISPPSGLFWNQQHGGRYSYGGARILLVQVLRRAGLKPARGRVGPRIHDLRHAMASHRLRDWYKEGINPQAKLPFLATYLGHKDIQSTLVYLNITPELLNEASERFRKNSADILSGAGELR